MVSTEARSAHAEIAANRDPIATHNLIATDDPMNEPALRQVKDVLAK
jgi:hypothetical protein